MISYRVRVNRFKAATSRGRCFRMASLTKATMVRVKVLILSRGSADQEDRSSCVTGSIVTPLTAARRS